MPTPDGESFATTEDPDLIIWHFIGQVSADDVRRIYAIQQRFCEGKSHAFVLVHVGRAGHITPEARRIAAEGPKRGAATMPIRGNAVVGASYQIRILGAMVSRAAALLTPANAVPLRFVDTESEARAWFDELRRKLGTRS